jgi:hypothetical protein
VVGDTEVDQIDEFAAGGSADQHVGWFDVAVYQALHVGGVQRARELLDHPNGPHRTHRAVPLKQLAKVMPSMIGITRKQQPANQWHCEYW